ncbi:hypothetical protein [Absidia glauca]|uniref:Uncharacterized protein n=1 Tax=Absidia glauca TaxID=4829 RepID=A0A168KV96_ABSGL|nr:hypothetical protein [Absidia glauca]
MKDRRKQTSDPKSIGDSEQREVDRKVVMFSSALAIQSTMKNPGAREPILVAIPFDLPRKKQSMMQKTMVSHDETNIDKNLPRKKQAMMQKTVVSHDETKIDKNLPRKKQAMMQKTVVSHDETKIDKTVRRKELPCIRLSRSLYRGQVVRGAVLMSMERKKG